MAETPDGRLPSRALILALAVLAAVVTVVLITRSSDDAPIGMTTTTATTTVLPPVAALPDWNFPGEPPPFAPPAGGSQRMAASPGGRQVEVRRADGSLLATGQVGPAGSVAEVRYYDEAGTLAIVISPARSAPATSARRGGAVRCGAESRASAGFRWSRFPIRWRVNLRRPPPRVSRGAARTAFIAARRTWARNDNYCRIPDRSRVAFLLRGSTRAGVGRDGIGSVGFGAVDRLGGSCFGAIACTITWTTGRVARESDILLDRTPPGGWFTAGRHRRSATDVQSVATHETGHMIGQDHVSTRSNVMFPSITRGDVSGRRLGRGDANANNAGY